MFKKKSLFSIISLSIVVTHAMDNNTILQIKSSSIHASHKLGKINLFHDEDGFIVVKNEYAHRIPNYSVDPFLRKMNKKQLKSFQDVGYIYVKECDDHSFKLQGNVRGPGAGPITASILYWITKATVYGGIGAAAVTATAATSGAAAAALGGGVAATAGTSAAAAAIGSAAATSTLGAAMSTTGAGIAAAAIGSSATATSAAAVGTGALAATTGSTVGMFAFVETLAQGAAWFGLMLPTP